jgi:hypothetical protein
MTRSECLKRSVECRRLAEAASEPEMKVYLLRLALCWMQAATSADERVLAERSSPKAAFAARGAGAGLDGESADRATVMPAPRTS